MINTLEIVRAGAGSGKTTDLCQTVADAVAHGLDPARILATTFTKRAAAELKGRIQAKLLNSLGGSPHAHQPTERIELAPIGTVHSVAHQLLSRYAIEMGLSPRLEIIEETGSKSALLDLLGNIPIDSWQPLAECADKLGIRDLHPRILDLLEVKRGNRISEHDFRSHLKESANRLSELLAPDGASDGNPPDEDHLYELADQALASIKALNDNTDKTGKAKLKLRQLRSNQLPLWGSYVEAIGISAGKKSGADDKLSPLRAHASEVRQNPRLHSDIRKFADLLASETLRLEVQYENYKTERGLVDFTDLEILVLALLENEALSNQLLEDFDLVLVDEFQDTNPLQLAIFQRLRKLSARSRWVGDPKQAIYGFRDTDPKLVNDIWENAPEAERTKLPNNHRSQRGLVQFVGALFYPHFGDDARQKPKKPTLPQGIERWIFETKNQPQDAIALACGVAKLHAEGTRLGDIVVLERANRPLKSLAKAFETLGIPYLLESPGLLDTCEAAMVMAGLRLVRDRKDSLAAATLLHLLSDPQKETPDWISERLQVLDGEKNQENPQGDQTNGAIPWEGDSRFAPIESIDRTISSPTLVLHQVIEALELPELIKKWSDPGQRCSNLDSLLRHALEYEELAFDTGQAATLGGMILYLEKLADENKDYRYPPQGHDAVSLITYHSAKGLEWPVVVLSGLDSDRSPDMWSPAVTGGLQNQENPLLGRTLRYWIWPFGITQGDFPRLRSGSGLEDDALTSPEGMDQAQRESEENLRLLYVGCTRAKEKLIFAHRDGKYTWLSQLNKIDSLLNPDLDEGEHPVDGIDTTLVLRRLNPEMANDFQFQQHLKQRSLALPVNQEKLEPIPRFRSPSQERADLNESIPFTEEKIGPPHFPSGAKEDQYAAIGEAVHRYLAALPSTLHLTDQAKERIAERCLSAFFITGLLPVSALISTGEEFRHWVERNFPDARWYTEVPVTGPRMGGGQWHGTADLLLRLPDGPIVLIDHKSAPIRREHCAGKATSFAPQLNGYREILIEAGETVLASYIHFPLAGVISRI